MTVEELITKLKEQPQTAQVVFSYYPDSGASIPMVQEVDDMNFYSNGFYPMSGEPLVELR